MEAFTYVLSVTFGEGKNTVTFDGAIDDIATQMNSEGYEIPIDDLINVATQNLDN
ncbi:hypothetical protein AAEO56_18585 [Flavobacterium sp. DGU11]|uniref:Uncharacterized protein n=1 Tax=Flavobacterium arundinis TaxID=3139143 RepID=A0ABU9I1I7_9FLAO